MRIKRTLLVVALVLAATGGALALADTISSIVAPDGTISGCYKQANGQLRVVEPGESCGPTELALQWNQHGQKGDTGAAGPQGSTGPAGAQGPTGPQGTKGDTGGQGLKGDTGATGPAGPSGVGWGNATRVGWSVPASGANQFGAADLDFAAGPYTATGEFVAPVAGRYAFVGAIGVSVSNTSASDRDVTCDLVMIHRVSANASAPFGTFGEYEATIPAGQSHFFEFTGSVVSPPYPAGYSMTASLVCGPGVYTLESFQNSFYDNVNIGRVAD